MCELISVIVPVYNVALYVEKSIRSLLQQTYENIEILVVDDGSTDGSGMICETIAKEDARITVLHKKNGGQGSARNVALDIARGKYICFLDSDDVAKKDYIEYLYHQLMEHSLDVAACNNELYNENGNFLKKRKNGNGYVQLTGIEAIKSMWTQGIINIGPWGKLYKRELWENVRFKECFSEDWATMHYVYEKAQRVGYTYECKVEYLIRVSSSIRSFQDKKLVMLEIAEDNMRFAKKYPELIPAARQKAVSVYFHILFQLPNEEKYKQIEMKIRKLITEARINVLRDRECTKKIRIALLLSYFGTNCAKGFFYAVKAIDSAF